MSSDRESTRIVRSWLEEGVNVLPDRVLDDVLDRLPTTPQRRSMWSAWRTLLMNSTVRFAAAGAVVLVVAAVAAALYFNRPAILPASSPSPVASLPVTAATPSEPAVVAPTDQPTSPTASSPQPSDAPAAARVPWIVFLRKADDAASNEPADLWAMRAPGVLGSSTAKDAIDAHEIFPDLSVPNIAWSQDGTRLLAVIQDVTGLSRVYLSEVSDVIGPFVDLGFDAAASLDCQGDSGRPNPCQSAEFSFAPDGERVVFVHHTKVGGVQIAELATLDLRTGEVAKLIGTLTSDGSEIELPAWSPDGSRIAFVRKTDFGVSGESGGDAVSNLYLIDADGTNLREIDMRDQWVTAPQWSPDSSTIAVASTKRRVTDSVLVQDIYTVRSDGTNLIQQTPEFFNPGSYSWPEWTSSDRLRVRTGDYTFIHVDVRHHARTAYGIDLTDALAAIEPPGTVASDLGRTFFWQPIQGR